MNAKPAKVCAKDAEMREEEIGHAVIGAAIRVHSALGLGDFKLGYLLNFKVVQMRDGIIRMVNQL